VKSVKLHRFGLVVFTAALRYYESLGMTAEKDFDEPEFQIARSFRKALTQKDKAE
jgi:hypothetical protein